jgi:Domain of unknown function (DUF5666)
MMDETSIAPRSRRPRWPIAAALIAIAAGALGFTIAVVAGLPGSAPAAPIPGAAAPAAAPADAAPAAAAPAEQGGAIVDVGWVAPAGRDNAKAPALGGGPGYGSRLGAITITKIDGAKLSLVTADGWTRTIDATGATITRDGATIAVGDLAVGDEIVLRQQRQADGTFKITAIRVILPKVAGTVSAVAASSLTLAARDGTKTTVKLTASTTYRLGKAAADASVVKVGMQAVVTGTKASDGTLTATSVTVKASTVAGTVAATSGSTITITARDGSKVAVKVTSATTYRVAGVEKAALTDVKVGMWIVVQGLRNDDGSFTASTVAAAAAGKHKGWGDWKPDRGGPDKASPAPAATQQPSSNG